MFDSITYVCVCDMWLSQVHVKNQRKSVHSTALTQLGRRKVIPLDMISIYLDFKDISRQHIQTYNYSKVDILIIY